MAMNEFNIHFEDSSAPFTLFAYRANGEDFCMGHCQGRSDSDFRIVHCNTEERLVQEVANLFARKPSLEECPWEIFIVSQGDTEGLEERCKQAAEAARSKWHKEQKQLEERAAEHDRWKKENAERLEYERLRAKWG